MKPWQIILLILAGLAVVVFLIANALLGLTAAPVRDFADLESLQPAIRIRVNTEPAREHILQQIQQSPNINAPDWLVSALLPHGGEIWLAPDYETETVELRFLLREKRLGPLMVPVLQRLNLSEDITELAFAGEGFTLPKRGALTLNAWAPLEQNAADDIWPYYQDLPNPDLAPMDGDHLLEIRAENRNGTAFLVLASLLYAYEIDLDEQEEQISLTSFKFVHQIALTADIVRGDSIGFHLAMDIEPGKKDKLAVVNLKVGLDELFERLAQDLPAERNLTLTGHSHWEDHTLHYTYRLDDLPTLLSDLSNDQ